MADVKLHYWHQILPFFYQITVTVTVILQSVAYILTLEVYCEIFPNPPLSATG
jgi:hypothetical protein